MISPRSISRRCIASSMRSISAADRRAEGGAGLSWRSPSWRRVRRGIADAPGGAKRHLKVGHPIYAKKTLTPARFYLNRRCRSRRCRIVGASGHPCPGRRTRAGDEDCEMVEAEVSVALDPAARAREADIRTRWWCASADQPLKLDAGVELAPFQIAYQTYGTLNAERSNAVLICHALTGDQHVANVHPVTGKPGWWETMVGPGQADRHRALLRHLPQRGRRLHGHDRPGLDQPADRQAVGPRFPGHHHPRHGAAQAMLLDHLGIDSLFSAAGGSMGGMQVLQWAASYPERVFSALPIAAATRHSAQNIAFHEVGRQAVMADPEWRHGRYLVEGTNPRRGLAVARMGAHITYLSDAALHRKFGRQVSGPRQSDLLVRRRLPGGELPAPPGHHLRRALRRQLLSLSHARDGLFRSRGRLRRRAGQRLRGTPTRFCVISFTSDWLFPTSDSRAIVHALNAGGARVSFAEIVPTRATTPSCSTSRSCSRSCAASSKRGRRARGRRRPEVMLLRLGAISPWRRRHAARRRARRPAARRRHGRARSRVLDVGCGDGELLRLLARRAASTGAASSCRARASTNASPRASR